jgi:sortase A
MPKIHSFTYNQFKVGTVLVAFGLLIAVITIVLDVHVQNTTPKPPPGAIQSASAPSSLKPAQSAVVSYTVPASDPKYISVPIIEISNARIVRLGLLASGQIAVPNNIYDTGWYGGSALPGHLGAMFIYGHVSSWTNDGVFYNLKKLKAGDTITITRGDNTTYNYQVVSVKIYPYNNVDMEQVLAPIDASKPGLNLMTCTGQVIKGTSEFNERLVVFTSLVTT